MVIHNNNNDDERTSKFILNSNGRDIFHAILFCLILTSQRLFFGFGYPCWHWLATWFLIFFHQWFFSVFFLLRLYWGSDFFVCFLFAFSILDFFFVNSRWWLTRIWLLYFCQDLFWKNNDNIIDLHVFFFRFCWLFTLVHVYMVIVFCLSYFFFHLAY